MFPNNHGQTTVKLKVKIIDRHFYDKYIHT